MNIIELKKTLKNIEDAPEKFKARCALASCVSVIRYECEMPASISGKVLVNKQIIHAVEECIREVHEFAGTFGLESCKFDLEHALDQLDDANEQLSGKDSNVEIEL